MFLTGLDANYVPLMRKAGREWRDRDGREIDLFPFLRSKGASCLRIRIWVGNSGPSRLPYGMRLAEEAWKAGLKIQPTIFLSDGWADLYKQPAPKTWASISSQHRLKLIEYHIFKVVRRLLPSMDKCVYYQVGNEIDYGICGIFASNKKKRKNIRWLKKHVWTHEAMVLKTAIQTIRMYDEEKPIALHLGKWWDPLLAESFLSAMEELNVEYEIACFSFYPTMFGANFEPLRELERIAGEKGKTFSIAEYAYPSSSVKGQFWYMNKPSPGYPLTPEGQSSWVRDFLAQCRRLNLFGAFYWSPELYLARDYEGSLAEPQEMPLSFGWGPMSFFDRNGCARQVVNSLRNGTS